MWCCVQCGTVVFISCVDQGQEEPRRYDRSDGTYRASQVSVNDSQGSYRVLNS